MEQRQNRRLAKGIFSVYYSFVSDCYQPVFILHLDFKLLDGFHVSLNPTIEWAISNYLQDD